MIKISNMLHTALSFIVLPALTLAASACQVEEAAGPENTADELVEVNFTCVTGTDTRTVYSDGSVLWEESDRISLFSGEDFATKTELSLVSMNDAGKTAIFKGLASSGSSEFVAVYPHAEVNAYAEGVLTVAVPSVQKGVAGGFESGSNVSVAVTGNDSDAGLLQFRNVSALISFRFETAEEAANTKSVTFKARKSQTAFWGLTGNVSVSLDEDSVPSASEGSADHVTIEAPEGGFVAKRYYAPVCPVGDCEGFQIVFTDLSGKQTVKNNATAFRLLRSQVVDLDCLPVSYPSLPERIELNLDFASGWPFVEDCVAAEEQIPAGEVYTYPYDYTGSQGDALSGGFQFAFNSGPKGNGTYSYDDSVDDGNGRAFCYSFTGTDSGYGYIKFPVIEGRYLESVTIVHRTQIPSDATGNDLNGFYFTLQKGGFPSYEQPSATTARVKAGDELLITLPFSTVTPELGRHYSLRVRFKDMEFERITLVYSAKKPSKEMELPENTRLFAHRGRWSKAASGDFEIPENSIHGIREAALMGYTGVECDVKLLTKDGKMVVNHDPTLDRTMRNASDYSDVTGSVRLDALTLEEIRNNYVLESSVPEFRVAPPTLEEFLYECRRCSMTPMLHSSYPQAYRLAAEIMGDDWVCFGSNYDDVKAVREYSGCTILWSVSSGTAEEIIAKLAAIGGDCGISSMEYDLYTPEFVGAIREAGYHVQCSIFPEASEKEAVANGVDYILSDNILPVGSEENGSVLDNPQDQAIEPLPGFAAEDFKENTGGYIGIL